MDSHGRILRDLRVRVTDRCDFRCLSCLPETEAAANSYRDPLGQGCQFHAHRPPVEAQIKDSDF